MWCKMSEQLPNFGERIIVVFRDGSSGSCLVGDKVAFWKRELEELALRSKESGFTAVDVQDAEDMQKRIDKLEVGKGERRFLSPYPWTEGKEMRFEDAVLWTKHPINKKTSKGESANDV